MSTDFPTAPLASRLINQRAAAPWKSLSLRLTHKNPDTPTISGVLPGSAYTASTSTARSVPALAELAANLATEGSVVATLGSASGTSPTYNAEGILDAILQAGATAGSASDASGAGSGASSTTGQAASAGASSATAGVYDASGTLQALNVSTGWTSLLQANPALASTVLADSTDKAIVGSISTTA